MTNYQVALNFSVILLWNALNLVDGFTTQSHLLNSQYVQRGYGLDPHAETSSYSAKSRLYDMTTSSNFEFPEDVPNDRKTGRTSKSNPGTENRENDESMTTSSPSNSRFVVGDSLHVLRSKVLDLREKLVEARNNNEKHRVNKLERAIVMGQAMDAEFVYAISIERMEAALAAGLRSEAEEYERDAMAARSALPQFNLEGLWVGKYGDHGFEMINVTYVGNTLVAHKVTGDVNVPKGEASFKVDLNLHGFKSTFSSQSSFTSSQKSDPAGDFSGMQEGKISENMKTDPIELSEEAAKKWGCKYLERFAGSGHIATEDFESSEWIDGQMILVKDYFCFAWLPIEHQVFFGRPTGEYILKHLRETNELKPENNEVALSDLSFLERCMEETDLLDDEMEADNITPFVSHEQEDYYHQEGCFE